MKRAENDETGVIHYMTSKKGGPADTFLTYCGTPSGMFWKKIDREPTCPKCLSKYNDSELKTLASAMKGSQSGFLKKFRDLSKACRFRTAHNYRRDYFAWCCEKKTSPFDWGCKPDSCPLMGEPLIPDSVRWTHDIEVLPTKEDFKRAPSSSDKK
jgi:hypothetical protein